MKEIVTALKPLFDRIQSNFDRIDARFEQIDGWFEQIDGRFEQIDGRFEQIDGRFEQIDNRFEKIDSRFERLDIELADVKGTVHRTAVDVAKVKGDLIDIKLEMASKRDIARQESRLTDFITEVENSRKERKLAEKSYMRHEERLNDHDQRLSRLEKPRD